MLAHLTGVDDLTMMPVAPAPRVIHVTTCIGIVDAIHKIKPGPVLRAIERGHEALVKRRNRASVHRLCGIASHADENGLSGDGEEEEKSIPAVRARGLDVTSLPPADTRFDRASHGDFDFVVAMYHG